MHQMGSQETQFVLNSKVLWCFGQTPQPSVLAKIILVASGKNPDWTSLGRIQRSGGSNLLESPHNRRKNWRVSERATRILTLSVLCAFLCQPASLSYGRWDLPPMGLWLPLAHSLTTSLTRKEWSQVQKFQRRALTDLAYWGISVWDKG